MKRIFSPPSCERWKVFDYKNIIYTTAIPMKTCPVLDMGSGSRDEKDFLTALMKEIEGL
jgi:hypothetical protein